MVTRAPEFQTLSEADARALLERLHVGRIAYSSHDGVDIEPIHYVAEGDWIYGRTSFGSKLATLSHNPWCAFEADEVRDMFDWDSVVAKGTFVVLEPEAGSEAAYKRARTLLRKFLPGSLSAADPVPYRIVVFGIHVAEITGRSARPGG